MVRNEDITSDDIFAIIEKITSAVAGVLRKQGTGGENVFELESRTVPSATCTT